MIAPEDFCYLSDIYIAASQEPAEQVFDYRQEHAAGADGSSSSAAAAAFLDPVIMRDIHDKPLVWVVPNLVTAEETQHLLYTFEGNGNEHQAAFGKDLPQSLPTLVGDQGGSLSHALLPRLQQDFAHRQQNSNINNNLHSVCSKWRVLKLQEDEEFPAHQDAMDSYHARDGFCVSTHSVLLDLHVQDNTPEEVEEDGAVRFYYRASGTTECLYDNSIDVLVPNGYGIVFEQHRDLYYAAQALRRQRGSNRRRYLAQAGLMQTLPKGSTMESLRGAGAASTFVLGPGLLDFLEQEAEIINGGLASSPVGWGRNFNPKATLWKHGKPIIKVDRSSILQQRQQGHHQSLGLGLLVNEQRWSTLNLNTIQQDIRRKSQRRRSLQSQVDPIRKRVSYVGIDNSKNGTNRDNEDDTDASQTEFSTYHEEQDPITITPVPRHKGNEASSYKPYGVTRKPKENSLVGRLVKVFQRK